MKTEEKIKAILAPLIAEARKEIFSLDYQNQISDAQCLGIIVSKFLEWDADEIIQMAKSAFEDSNLHDGVQVLNKYLDDLENVALVDFDPGAIQTAIEKEVSNEDLMNEVGKLSKKYFGEEGQ